MQKNFKLILEIMHEHITEHKIAISDREEVIVTNTDERQIVAIDIKPYRIVVEEDIRDERLAKD